MENMPYFSIQQEAQKDAYRISSSSMWLLATKHDSRLTRFQQKAVNLIAIN